MPFDFGKERDSGGRRATFAILVQFANAVNQEAVIDAYHRDLPVFATFSTFHSEGKITEIKLLFGMEHFLSYEENINKIKNDPNVQSARLLY